MAKRKGTSKETKTEIPDEALRQFELLDGAMPLAVIQELFSRAQISEAIQVAFWQEAAVKKPEDFVGIVGAITTHRDGRVEVKLVNLDGSKSVTFQNKPNDQNPDLTDAQMKEIKRAQGNRTFVRVKYQVEDGGKKPVNSVAVVGLPPADSGGHQTPQVPSPQPGGPL